MLNRHLYTAISSPRFSRYFNACGSSKRKALKLYRANIRLSQELYGVIGVFEVVLRNSIDRHYKGIKGDDWLADAVADTTGFLNAIGCEESYHAVQDGIHKLGLNYTHDNLVAKLTFGFWTYQYEAKEYTAGGSTLINAFPLRPHGTKQKDIYKYLFKINDIRNRIAHYEPLCFDKHTGGISTALISRRYTLILDLLEWLGCAPKKILFGIDGVQKELSLINTI